MRLDKLDSDFLRYVAAGHFHTGDRLPSMEELSAELKISVGKLREQLEVARSLGLVDVRPRLGIRLEEYDFLPALRLSVMFALASDPSRFQAFSDLRNHLEAAFWHEAVTRLTEADHQYLHELLRDAWAKLDGQPIQIPHAEHRALHLAIFSRMENPFVKGLLEAYWEAYEAVGLNVYSDYQYLREVWTFHADIVNSIVAGNHETGYRLLCEHTHLLRHRETAPPAVRLEPAGAAP